MKRKIRTSKTLKTIFVTLLMLLPVLSLLSGCQKSLSSKTTLRMVTLSEPRSFDPYLTQPLAQRRWSFLVFDGLWKVDNQGRIKENLAYLPEFLKRGKVVRVRLKKGIKWQDGQPLTASDVEFTWRVLNGEIDPDYKPELYPPYTYIEKVEVKNENTLSFYLKKPFYSFVYLFPAIFPKHLLAKEKSIVNSDFWFKPVGTGPYRLGKWKTGKQMVFEANRDYFKGQPKIKKIEVAVVFSAEEAIKLIKKGKVDLWQDIPEDDVKPLLASKGVKETLKKYPVGWETIFLNIQGQWFKVDDFREAIFSGVDWGKGRAFMGKKEASLFGMPPLKKYQRILEQYVINLNRKQAVGALHRQGYKNLGPMKLWEKKRDETFQPQLAFDARFQFFNKKRYNLFVKILREDAEKTKIDLRVNLFVSRMFQAPKMKAGSLAMGQNFDLLYYSQEFYPHPLMRKPFLSDENPKVNDRGLNFAYYSSAEIEKNYQEAEQTKDESKQIKYLSQIYKELHKNKVLIPFGYTYHYAFKSPALLNFQPPLFRETSFLNVEKWELK